MLRKMFDIVREALDNNLMGLDYTLCSVPFGITKRNKKSILAIGSLLELHDVSYNCIR